MSFAKPYDAGATASSLRPLPLRERAARWAQQQEWVRARCRYPSPNRACSESCVALSRKGRGHTCGASILHSTAHPPSPRFVPTRAASFGSTASRSAAFQSRAYASPVPEFAARRHCRVLLGSRRRRNRSQADAVLAGMFEQVLDMLDDQFRRRVFVPRPSGRRKLVAKLTPTRPPVSPIAANCRSVRLRECGLDGMCVGVRGN